MMVIYELKRYLDSPLEEFRNQQRYENRCYLEGKELFRLDLSVQFKVQTLVNLNRTPLNLNRRSSPRFSQMSEPNLKFDSWFSKFVLEPDRTELRHNYLPYSLLL